MAAPPFILPTHCELQMFSKLCVGIPPTSTNPGAFKCGTIAMARDLFLEEPTPQLLHTMFLWW